MAESSRRLPPCAHEVLILGLPNNIQVQPQNKYSDPNIFLIHYLETNNTHKTSPSKLVSRSCSGGRAAVANPPVYSPNGLGISKGQPPGTSRMWARLKDSTG